MKDRSDFINYDENHVKEYLVYAKGWLNYSGIETYIVEKHREMRERYGFDKYLQQGTKATKTRVVKDSIVKGIGFGVWRLHIYKFLYEETSYDPNVTYTNFL